MQLARQVVPPCAQRCGRATWLQPPGWLPMLAASSPVHSHRAHTHASALYAPPRRFRLLPSAGHLRYSATCANQQCPVLCHGQAIQRAPSCAEAASSDSIEHIGVVASHLARSTLPQAGPWDNQDTLRRCPCAMARRRPCDAISDSPSWGQSQRDASPNPGLAGTWLASAVLASSASHLPSRAPLTRLLSPDLPMRQPSSSDVAQRTHTAVLGHAPLGGFLKPWP